MDVPVLIISGTVGVGKTTVGYEIHDILSDHQMPHAFIDRDALAHSWPPQGPYNETLVQRNIASVWQNFREAGARRLVVAGVVEHPSDLEGYKQAIPGAMIQVCRLVAAQPTRQARLKIREVESSLAWYLHRTVELEQILEQRQLENFVVDNDGRSLGEVALEVLTRANWLKQEQENHRSESFVL